LRVRRRVEEADVLVHVEDIAVREAFDIFAKGDKLLDILILARGEDGVVDYDSVYFVVRVGLNDAVFEVLFFDFAEVELKTTGWE